MSDSIRDKIRKLLALGEGNANEAEAAQAMKMASTLMMRHGIEQDELRTTEQRAKVVQSEAQEASSDWHVYCAQAAAKLYGVKPLKTPTGFLFVGRSDNNDAAMDTTVFIILQVEQLYKQSLPSGMTQRERAAYRRDFKRVCAGRVYDRCLDLSLEEPEAGSTGGGLVIYQHREKLQAEIDDFLSSFTLGTSKPRRTKAASSRAYNDGLSAGDRVDLHRKVV